MGEVRGEFEVNIDLCVISIAMDLETVLTDDFSYLIYDVDNEGEALGLSLGGPSGGQVRGRI